MATTVKCQLSPVSYILLAPLFAGSIWKWPDVEDSFTKLSKDRL